MSGDTVSSLFPDRPIRPLPRRRLRERLSPEAADSIQYPPAPPTTAPLFPYPYSVREDEADGALVLTRERPADPASRYSRNTPGALAGTDHDDASVRINVVSRALPDPTSRFAGPPASIQPDMHLHLNVHPPLSGASSADGYESLENNNNKKKRKIPAAGDPALHGVHVMVDASGTTMLSANGSLLERPTGTEGALTGSPYSAPAGGSFPTGAQNVPGPGRGRYGRIRNGRSPLQTLSDSTTNHWASRTGKSRWAHGPTESTGIISTAIANAEKLPPHEGQENTSLLHQQLAAKPASTPGQFTFTVDNTQVPGALAWPGTDVMSQYPPYHPPPPAGFSAPTGTGHSMPPPPLAGGSGLHDPAVPGGAGPQPSEAQRPAHRQVDKAFIRADKARRRETLRQNRRNPPRPGEFWICNFCDYETIWGEPPKNLVRQYEIKAREQRRAAEERNRHLERLKRNRQKSKKPTKSAAAKGTVVPDAGQAAHVYDEEGDDNDAVPEFEPRHGNEQGIRDPARPHSSEAVYGSSGDETPVAGAYAQAMAG